MKLPRRQFLHLVAGAAALPAASPIVMAQAYPSRSITMVVPFAAGGPVDTLARIVAERMRASLGQPVVIENVTGAGGSIGTGRVARAVPDGYTLVIGIWTTHVVNGAIYALQYDVLNDFEPIALLANNPQVIVAKKSMPANDLKGLIAWLKANPDKASAGTAGVASPQHVLGVFFQSATGTRFQFVHYRGGGPATQDLVAGQIDIIVADQVTALPQIRSGNIKAYAVTSKNRLAAAPDIPTVDEAGLPEFYTTVWNAIWALRARRRTSSPNSMRRSWTGCPIRRYAGGWPTLASRFLPDQQTPEVRSQPPTRPRSKSGGQSSRRRISSRNNQPDGAP
jgi:tripartite-type tricarboxylate transporter receptor subunit TctC